MELEPLYEEIAVTSSRSRGHAHSSTYTTAAEIQQATNYIEAMPKVMIGPELLTSVSSLLQLIEEQEFVMSQIECCECKNDERDSYRIIPVGNQTGIVGAWAFNLIFFLIVVL